MNLGNMPFNYTKKLENLFSLYLTYYIQPAISWGLMRQTSQWKPSADLVVKPGRNLGNKLPHHSWKYYPSLISLSLSLSLSSFVNIHYKWDTFLFLWTYITNVHLCLVSGLRVFNPFLLYFVISSCLRFEDLLSLEEFPANFSTRSCVFWDLKLWRDFGRLLHRS